MSKVRIRGFEVCLPDSRLMTLDDLLRAMVIEGRWTKTTSDYTYTYRVGQLVAGGHDLVCGMVLRASDDRDLLTSRKDGDDILVESLQLPDGSFRTDVGLFAMHRSSGRGLFYQPGASITMLRQLIQHVYGRLRSTTLDEKAAVTIAARHADDPEAPTRADIRRELAVLFGDRREATVRPIMSPRDIDQLLKEMKFIKGMRVSSPALIQEGLMSWARPLATGASETVTFPPTTGVTVEVREGIRRIAEAEPWGRRSRLLRILGTTMDGSDVDLFLGDNVLHFDEVEHSVYAQQLPESMDGFTECRAMRHLERLLTQTFAPSFLTSS